MDIRCPVCGEPWDMDTLHDEVSERIAAGIFAPLPERGNYYSSTDPQYQEYRKVYDGYYSTVRKDFRSKGCNGLIAFTGGNTSWCKPQQAREDGKLTAASAASVLMDIMGDDLDGVASMLDDLEYMGAID